MTIRFLILFGKGDLHPAVAAEQWAAMNFEPWRHAQEEWEPPSNKDWGPHGDHVLPFMRLAWITMYKTKAELETIADELEDDPFFEMVEGIRHSQTFFEPFLAILKSAELRILCAASAVEVRNREPDETS
jgi:hypothetical protein